MQQQLNIAISSYWHSGTGRTSGSHVDRLVAKNQDGLPFLGGRHIKGLLRDAVMRAEAWGWFNDLDLVHDKLSITDWWFGTRGGQDDNSPLTRFETTPGIIAVSNATLSDTDTYLLNQRPDLKDGLYRHLFSTAIDQETGTAKDRSLRGIEVVVPLELIASIECHDQQADTVFSALNQAMSLIDHIGGMRNRGLGRAELTLSKQGDN